MVIQAFFWIFTTLYNHKLEDGLPGGSTTVSESLLPKAGFLNCEKYEHWSLTNVIVLSEKKKTKNKQTNRREEKRKIAQHMPF